MEITVDHPEAADVQALLAEHLSFSRKVTPPGHVHALGLDALLEPSVTFFSAREAGVLLGVGALRELDPNHGEVKSMHTVAWARRRGIGRAMIEHLLTVALRRGYLRVSLETGTMGAFAPARMLYRDVGFRTCEPFGDYTSNPHSTCMTIDLGPG